jgi:hypothetical protein
MLLLVEQRGGGLQRKVFPAVVDIGVFLRVSLAKEKMEGKGREKGGKREGKGR